MTQHIGHIVICEEVMTANDGSPLLAKPLPMLIPISIPSNYSFSISVGLFNLKPNSSYKLNIQFKSTNSIMVNHNLNVEVPREPNMPSDTLAFSVFNVNCKNIVLPNEGDYEIEVTINDAEKKQLTVPVKKRNDIS